MNFRRKQARIFVTQNCADCYRAQCRVQYGRMIVKRDDPEMADALDILDAQI
jgi:hypothetical protein